MPTYVHLVRHAQGYHNLTGDHSLPDPDLTPLGREQCVELAAAFPLHDRVTHLVASPLRRTLLTALLSFAPALARVEGGRVVAQPDLQEIASLPCDTGSAPAVLEREFGDGGGEGKGEGKVDLGLVREGWNDKVSADSPYEPEMHKLEARARRARRWLRELGRQWQRENPGRGDAHVVAVTHGGFLHFLTQDWDGMNPEAGTGWRNTEWRTYEFVDEEEGDDGDARLRETAGSWRKRRGSEAGLTETEQRELRSVVERTLEEEKEKRRKELAGAKKDSE
ncbi:hypothetical protein VTK26DRAFT_5868 [Humicola hyalothermophila]